ncbi:MAG: hypothetical protein Q9188_006198 [Gyalolechia gomerana]
MNNIESDSTHQVRVDSHDSQTASEFIDSQLQLEADAREALPYTFDHCTQPLGALRQNLYSCLTCNPPPRSPSDPYKPAGVCYSCSIACHGEHELVELFNRRNFTCDCGTTRLPSTSPCTLRIDPKTGVKGPVHSEPAAQENTYNQNFRNRFCGCGEIYNAHTEKGTMFQCLGLAGESEGGCGEDWWHPECVLGLGRSWKQQEKAPALNGQASSPVAGTMIDENQQEVNEHEELPPGFPQEDDFETFICYKCVDANPWMKQYAGSTGFLPPVLRISATSSIKPDPALPKLADKAPTESEQGEKQEAQSSNSAPGEAKPPVVDHTTDVHPQEDSISTPDNEATIRPPAPDPPQPSPSLKRKASSTNISTSDLTLTTTKKTKVDTPQDCYYSTLPPPPHQQFSLFLHEDFRDHFCRCAKCYPSLRPHPQLLEEEESYEPPLSENDEGGRGSVGTGSLLDRGEAALGNVDRVRAIEGVMVYNHLKDKVKSFLQPFAESGQAVGAEDIKAYFEKLRGDEQGIRAAAGVAGGAGGDGDGEGDNRREQSGY